MKARLKKQFFLLIIDTLSIISMIYLAFYIRFEDTESIYKYEGDTNYYLITLVLSLLYFKFSGFYKSIIRYMGHHALINIIKVTTVSTFIFVTTAMFSHISLPRSIPFLYWALGIFFIGGFRFFIWYFYYIKNSTKKSRVAIYGAGSSGRLLLKSLKLNSEYLPFLFIDDNPKYCNHEIDGVRVYSSNNLKQMLTSKNISQIFLAMPSVDKALIQSVVNKLEPLHIPVKKIPDLQELISGKAKIEDLKKLEINDLLGREIVTPDESLLDQNIKNKIVMITGAGGSIGTELCRQIIKHKPKIIILYEISEYALYSIEKELLSTLNPSIEIIALLGSVQDFNKLKIVFSLYCVNTVYHAAAYKHVPMVEKNIIEGIQNNILGTYSLAKAALDAEVETFVLISTDKAVRPTNIMGATKRFSEQILQAFNTIKKSSTIFCMVRFGNVLGSSGSVIPLFQEQIKKGGPLTVTHPEITRYFMSIPEATQLVIQASSMGKGGDVFVLDMGKSVKIIDLAKQMIHLSGHEVKNIANSNGIEIKFTGLRPGEKLYEELLIGENVTKSRHPQIMRCKEVYLSLEKIEKRVEKLKIACNNYDYDQVLSIINNSQLHYQPTNKNISDPLFKNDG